MYLVPVGAVHACPAGSLPVHFTPPADPALAVWDVEGKITSYDRVARTITANGMTFSVPAGLLIKTHDLDQPVGNISLTDLTDPALEAVRSIIGGTAIAGGNLVFTAPPGGTCMSLVANSMFVELSENGVIGLLMSVDEAGGSFVVNGATVKMNTDPRFPSELFDIGGGPLTIADLVGNEGVLMDIGGYFDTAAGVLYGNFVQADVLKQQPGKDTVVIEKAQLRVSIGQLRAVGLVSRHPDTGLFAPSLAVHVGPINAAGTACTGVQVGTAVVDQVAGGFDFRTTLAVANRNATTICVASPGGGVDDIPLVRR